MVIPDSVAVFILERLFEDRNAWAAGQHEILDGRAGFDPDRVIKTVGPRAVGQDDFGLASVGTEFARTGDADERFGAGGGLDQTHGLELAVVGEGVGDFQRVQEVGDVVVEVGQRDGQLVEGVVDVVVDGEVVAALDDGVAIGAVFRAGDAEGEAVDEGLGVGAVVQRFGEVDLHRVVVVHRIVIALRPGDVDALVGSAGLDVANDFGHVGRRGVEGDIAHGRGFVQADLDAGRSAGRNVVVAETPFFLTGQIDRGDAGGLAPSLGERGVVDVVAVHIGEVLAVIAHAVSVGIDEGLEAGAVAVGLAGGAVVVAGITVGDIEPDVFDGQIGVDDKFIARATRGVAVGCGEENLSLRSLRVVVEDLREGLVERGRGIGVAVEMRAGAQDMEAFAQSGLRGVRPCAVRLAECRHAGVVVVREENNRRRIEVRNAEGGEHVLFVAHFARTPRPNRGGACFVEADFVGKGRAGGGLGDVGRAPPVPVYVHSVLRFHLVVPEAEFSHARGAATDPARALGE